MEFIPDKDPQENYIPYFEDASNADGVMGYSTTKSVKDLKAMISTVFGRLGGSVTGFQQGKFGTRHGYLISFTYQGVAGQMKVAGLPMRNETESRLDKVRRHALISIHARLESQYNSQLVMPGDLPLMPWLLNKKGQTMTEYLTEMNVVPSLPEPRTPDEDIIEGEFEDA